MSGYPGAPQGSYPGAPPSGYPGAPSAGYPGAPQPAGPQQGYPGVPQQGYPGAPQQGYPGAPQQGYPGAPQQGYPGAPQQGYPGSPQHGHQGAPQQGYPGAPQQGYQGAPPGYPGAIDPQVAQWFSAVDTDRSGQIDAKELQRALVNGNMCKFSEEATRMMIDMFDQDKTGQINVTEFGALFNYINQWKGTFEALDRDRSGSIDNQELTQALEQMGYRFSPTFINNLLSKYSPREKRLTLDNFIVASVQIKRLTDSFRSRDAQMRGQATMQYEDFVGLAMGAHK